MNIFKKAPIIEALADPESAVENRTDVVLPRALNLGLAELKVMYNDADALSVRATQLQSAPQPQAQLELTVAAPVAEEQLTAARTNLAEAYAQPYAVQAAAAPVQPSMRPAPTPNNDLDQAAIRSQIDAIRAAA